MYHYTYKIHYSTNKFYIGVRSSKCTPDKDDKYIGSSKVTPNDEIIRKEILGIFDNRKDALSNEMKHHVFNDVAKNDLYYNQALQNGTGFDSTGRKMSDEHKAKIAKASSKRKLSKESRQKISDAHKGKKHGPRSEEHRKKMSKLLKGRTSPFKGKKFSNLERENAYNSRIKYPEERDWHNKKTGEVFCGNPQELAIVLGVETSRVTTVIRGVVKSYHGWYLKELETD